jgi:hypothetical protein
MIEPIANHIELGLARLIEQYKNSTKFKLWLSVYLGRAQILENAIWEVLEKRSIANGVGVALDNIGKILNRPRGGLGDDDYKIALRAEIAILRSTGTADDMIRVGELSAPDGTDFDFTDLGNATLQILVDVVPVFSIETLFLNFLRAKQGGVKFLFEYPVADAAFVWDTGPDFGDATGADVGGYLTNVL